MLNPDLPAGLFERAYPPEREPIRPTPARRNAAAVGKRGRPRQSARRCRAAVAAGIGRAALGDDGREDEIVVARRARFGRGQAGGLAAIAVSAEADLAAGASLSPQPRIAITNNRGSMTRSFAAANALRNARFRVRAAVLGIAGARRLSSDEDGRRRDRDDERAEPGMSVLRRFLPYLWPAGEPAAEAARRPVLAAGAGLDPRHHPGHAARLRRGGQPDDGRDGAARAGRDRPGLRLCRRRASAACCSTICATASSSGSARTRPGGWPRRPSATSTICRCASTSSGAPARSPRSSSAAPRAST